MARPKLHHIQLSDDEVQRLKSIIKKKNTNQTTVNRCRVLLAMDENHPPVLTYVQCVTTYGVSRATIATLVKNFSEGGINAALARKRNINSDQARRKVDGRTEARIIEMACGPVPAGHGRWTIRLLEKELKVVLDEPVSREAIRRTLKKSNFDLTKTITGAFHL